LAQRQKHFCFAQVFGISKPGRGRMGLLRVALWRVVLGALVAPAAPWSVPAFRLLHKSGPRHAAAIFASARPRLRRSLVARFAACAQEDEERARALVSTSWLQDQIDKGATDLVILDVRGQVGKKDAGGGRVETTYEALVDAFADAHVPGAVFVDWTRDIVDLLDETAPVQLAPLDVFAANMEEKGVGTGKTVVIYDTGKMLFATRLWWALTIYGHEDVRILNGGWKRWIQEDRPTESGLSTCPLKLYASFEAREARPWLRCDAGDVRELLPSLQVERAKRGVLSGERQACQLIDARGKVQFDGSEIRALRGGHIPGAVNVPYKVLIDVESGGYLPLHQLREKLEARGVFLSRDSSANADAQKPETVIYCNGGVASTAVLFAMWQLGVPLSRLSNYDGSWGEWGNRSDDMMYPIELADL
jgi:thiosulfate/3-mercaptopyruvate sulfurtransferase